MVAAGKYNFNYNFLRCVKNKFINRIYLIR